MNDKLIKSPNFLLAVFSLIFILAVIVVAVIDRQQSSMIWLGDFPGFYGPSFQVFAHDTDINLYDLESQRAVQNRFFPSLKNSFYIFAYPPFTTLLYAPFLHLDPLIAKIGCSLLMFIFSFLAFRLIAHNCQSYLSIILGSFAFLPLFIANVAAQNTGLTLILLAIGFQLLCRKTEKYELLAGICFGLMAYKPQFGVFMLMFLIVMGYRNALIGMGLAFVALYTCGAVISGVTWPLEWLKVINQFSFLNYENNLSQLCSLSAIVYILGQKIGVDNIMNQAASIAIFVISFIAVSWILYRYKKSKGNELPRLFFFWVSAIPLVSPQTLYYDLGIAFFGICGLIAFRSQKSRSDAHVILFACCLGILCEIFRSTINFPIYSILSLIVFYFALIGLGERRISS